MAEKKTYYRRKKAPAEVPTEAPAVVVPHKVPKMADVMASKQFQEAMDAYASDLGSIPALLRDLLRESVAMRLILERKV